MKIYTKKGDKGRTSLVGGERVSKDDLRVEAYGSIDELSAFIALLHDKLHEQSPKFDSYIADLQAIQSTLMSVEAVLARGSGAENKVVNLASAEIDFLERRIDEMESALAPLTRFTIPGGHPFVSLCHICRTVCRRAERAAIRATDTYTDASEGVFDTVLQYLNRLSDYFYQLGRKLCLDTNSEEIYWNPPPVE